MVPLVRDLFRKDVHQPEQDDEHDRDEEEREEGDVLRHRVFGLGGQQRCMCRRREGQRPRGCEQTDDDRPRGVTGAGRGVENTRVLRHEKHPIRFELSTRRATPTCDTNGRKLCVDNNLRDVVCRDAGRRRALISGFPGPLRHSGGSGCCRGSGEIAVWALFEEVVVGDGAFTSGIA